MPEGLEVELYRRAVEAAIGRRVVSVLVDAHVADPGVGEALVDTELAAVRRRGKQLVIDLEPPDGSPMVSVGIHFGMTGRIVVAGHAPIEQLEYGAARDDPAWDRLVVELDDASEIRVNDPRRWSKVTVAPDLDRLGPDLLEVTPRYLRAVSASRRTSLKAVLLDQRAVAGLGNMLVDELLWQAGLEPRRVAAELHDEEVRRLHAAMTSHLPAMLERGGSHTGTISPEVRAAVPPCPADGAPLQKTQVAGRSTVWCPEHQR